MRSPGGRPGQAFRSAFRLASTFAKASADKSHPFRPFFTRPSTHITHPMPVATFKDREGLPRPQGREESVTYESGRCRPCVRTMARGGEHNLQYVKLERSGNVPRRAAASARGVCILLIMPPQNPRRRPAQVSSDGKCVLKNGDVGGEMFLLFLLLV